MNKFLMAFCSFLGGVGVVDASDNFGSILSEGFPHLGPKGYFSEENQIIGPTGSSVYPIGNNGCYVDPQDNTYFDSYGRIISTPYDPMFQSVVDSQGLKYYKPNVDILNLDENNLNGDFKKHNKIFIQNLDHLDVISGKDFCSIRDIDFSKIVSESLDLLKIKNFFNYNKTFVSLCTINFGELPIGVDLLNTIKSLSFEDKPLIREKPFLDNRYEVYTAPIKIFIKKNFKEIIKSDLKNVLKPVQKPVSIIYTGFPYEERLARLKLYIKFVE